MRNSHIRWCRSLIAIFAILLAVGAASSKQAVGDPAINMGSGCIFDGDSTTTVTQKCQALNYEGVKSARLSINPDDYWWWGGAPQPNLWVAGVVQTMHTYGITPMFLFEYYAADPAPEGTMLTSSQWQTVGQAFAQEFAPNSSWWTAQGIYNFGCTTYEAFNEPDIQSVAIPFTQYHDALNGLATGVHSVSSTLKVFPGGFATPNAYSNFTMAGYGTAIADLWNNGTLDGMDLHTYSNWYAPVGTHTFSSQYAFDHIKTACAITRDINFYCTEFNYMELIGEGGSSPANIGETAGSDYLLTCTWDQLGVVGNAGEPVSQASYVYTLYDTQASDPSYGLCTQLSPYVPIQRATVYQLVAQLTAGMYIVSSDPKNTGVIVLNGNNKKMWVWQDRTNWTNAPGTSFTVTGIPTTATSLKVYGYNGLRTTYTLSGVTSKVVTGLPGNETYMFVVNASTNSITNPGFELNPVNANGWGTASWLGSPVFTWSSSVAHAGTHSAELSGTNIDAAYYAGYIPSIPVTPSTRYTFSTWAKTTSVTGTGVYATLSLYDSSGTFISNYSTNTLIGTNGWTQLSDTLTLPSNAATADFWLTFAGSGTAYFDDVLLSH